MKKTICRNATMHNQNVLHGDTQHHRRPVRSETERTYLRNG
jgi:hypothetical protein